MRIPRSSLKWTCRRELNERGVNRSVDEWRGCLVGVAMNSEVIPSGVCEATRHIPVLEREVIAALGAERGGHYLDCTLGGGGHSNALLRAHPETTVVATDRDPRAVERARERFRHESRITIHHGRFSEVAHLVGEERFDGIFADLGMSTDQLYESRGFSFRDADALDMRMDVTDVTTAASLVNEASPGELIRVLKSGGVGREASRIVAEVVRSRPVVSAQQLSELVCRVVPRTGGSHPATVVFQALRIAVNREFEEIDALLAAVPQLIRPGGRLAIICFHSLEDQRVTRHLRRWAAGDTTPAAQRGPQSDQPLGRLLTKHAIEPTAEEVAENPASRSARLRVFEFSG